MLKFIRKYQLPILVVGGSLLMIVFLLQPVLTKLSPSPAKAKIATLASGSAITAGDRQMAQFELEVIKNVYPQFFQPGQHGGVLFDTDSSKQVLQWFMLAKQATDAGVVADAADGRDMISQIAEQTAGSYLYQQGQQGLITAQEAEDQFPTLTAQFTTTLTNRAASMSGMVPGMQPDDVFRVLAKARGVDRFINLYGTTPALSDLGYNKAAHASFDAVAVNATTIPANVFAANIPDPTEDELQAFFDEYKDQFPAQTDFGIGYQQPTRVRLAYLKIDRQMLFDAVIVDRAELAKLHTLNTDPEKGDFASERAALERKYRDDKATQMMIEADRLVRSLVQQSVKGFPVNSGRYELPEDWDARRPKLEAIAESVVEGLREQYGVNLPTLTINVHGSDWLDARQILTLPGYGTASYRVGAQQFETFKIPTLLTLQSNSKALVIQPGLPLADPAAVDAANNRYYAVVLKVNEAGPADSIDDAQRDRVLKDYKEIKSFNNLVDRTEELSTILASTGILSDAINAALTGATDAPTPEIQRNILVTKDSIDRGRLTLYVNPALNVPAFRDAVMQTAESIDKFAEPGSILDSDRAIAVPLPASRSLALATIVAPRPMTIEQFRVRSTQVLSKQVQTELAEAIESYPFSYDALATKFGLKLLRDLDEDDS